MMGGSTTFALQHATVITSGRDAVTSPDEPVVLRRGLTNKGCGIAWRQSRDLVTFFRELSDDARISSVVQRPDSKEIGSRRFLRATRGNTIGHPRVAFINDSL